MTTNLWQEEFKILFVALVIGWFVYIGQYAGAALLFSYGTFRILLLIGVAIAKEKENK